MDLRKQKKEQGEIVKDACTKMNAVEKELSLATTQINSHDYDVLKTENSQLKQKVEDLIKELKLAGKKASDYSDSDRKIYDLKEQLDEARQMVQVYKNELDLAEKEIREKNREPAKDDNPKVIQQLKELEKLNNHLKEKYLIEQKDKIEAYDRLSLFKLELEKQEEFFKRELEGFALLVKKAEHSHLDGPLIEDVIDRFNLLQDALRAEREGAEHRILKDKEMAREVLIM